jgi:ubiquinone biosynthesis protein
MKLQTIRNIFRVNRIIAVMIKYGFGGVVAELSLLPYFSFLNLFLVFRRAGRGLTTAERIRKVLEELGPTFVKLGQVASTRADLFPPDWIEEFKKLQDMVPPCPFEDMKKVVEGSLRAPLEKKFASFDTTPVASASIAQVHYARLLDSTEVAVKVKRPNIEKTISADISVMRTVAELLERHLPASRRLRPIEMVEEFARVITNELDLSIEGANAALFGRLLKDEPLVKIPRVYWNYTTPEVLTMEKIEGTPLDEAEKIKAKGLDIKKIALNGVTVFFKQVFDYGVFHADLHPGNIFTTDEGVIVYLDFGIVGRLDRELKEYLASMLFQLVRQDYHRLAVLHREMGLIGKEVDLRDFEHALRDIAEPIFGKTLEEISVATLLMKLIQVGKRFNVTLQPNLLLLQKSMVIMEGVGRQLYPEVNMWQVAKPLIYRWMMKEKFSPEKYMEKGREFAEELAGVVFDFPQDLHSLLKSALRDELKIGFIHERLEPLSKEIERAGRKIAVGVVVSSLVLGSAVAAAFSGEEVPKLWGLPYPATVGFIAAFPLVVWILLSGKEKTQ